MRLFLLVTALILFLDGLESYKILVLAPFPSASHYLWISHFIKALLDKGHRITAVTSSHAKFKHKRFTELVLNPSYNLTEDFSVVDIFNMRYSNYWEFLKLNWRVGLASTEFALNDMKVKKLIEREDQFDLIISEQFFQESMLMFAHKFRCPIVTIDALGHSDFMDRAMGFLTPWATVPHGGLEYTDEMTMLQRTWNVAVSLADAMLRDWYYLPAQERLAKKYFKALEKKSGLPTVQELEKSISLMLINADFTTVPPQPLMPGMINIAGAHIQPPKLLPPNIQKFLDEAKYGVIVFSMGSVIQSKLMPPGKLKIFINVFRNLKQRVLMKYEEELPHAKTANIMTVKWFPQSDVLAHKNVILFITHGGIFSFQEALYHAVPMLVIPFYGDQHKNAMRAEQTGYGLKIPYNQLNSIELRAKITEIITQNQYKERAQDISYIFRDTPIPVMDQAVYWIEYVIRHNGAPHLKSAGVNLPWYKHMLLDVIVVYLLIGLILTFAVRCLVKKMIQMYQPLERPKSE